MLLCVSLGIPCSLFIFSVGIIYLLLLLSIKTFRHPISSLLQRWSVLHSCASFIKVLIVIFFDVPTKEVHDLERVFYRMLNIYFNTFCYKTKFNWMITLHILYYYIQHYNIHCFFYKQQGKINH